MLCLYQHQDIRWGKGVHGVAIVRVPAREGDQHQHQLVFSSESESKAEEQVWFSFLFIFDSAAFSPPAFPQELIPQAKLLKTTSCV